MYQQLRNMEEFIMEICNQAHMKILVKYFHSPLKKAMIATKA